MGISFIMSNVSGPEAVISRKNVDQQLQFGNKEAKH